jgi:HD domain
MPFFACSEHEAVWRLARPFLDVRDNDVHTLHAYALGRVLLQPEPDADAQIVLVSILLHDTGWSQMPHDKIKQAIGPNAKYPELQREHELAGMTIARDVLGTLRWPAERIQRVVDIVDGHDTRKHALSLEDALMKDADKLWRFTPHGIGCIADWFSQTEAEIVELLESYVVPQLLRPETVRMAHAYLATARTTLASAEHLA